MQNKPNNLLCLYCGQKGLILLRKEKIHSTKQSNLIIKELGRSEMRRNIKYFLGKQTSELHCHGFGVVTPYDDFAIDVKFAK